MTTEPCFDSSGVICHAPPLSADGRCQSIRMTVMDPSTDSDWDQTVREHPECTVFHSSAWAKVLRNTYGHRPVYLRFRLGDQLMASIPMMEVSSPITGLRGVGLPFTDVCRPLLCPGMRLDEILAQVSDEAKSRGWRFFEIRSEGKDCAPSCNSGRFIGHTLGLRSQAAELFARFSSPVRRAIRKAERSKLTVRIATDRDGVKEFYRLHIQTRRRHGIPPQPFEFFSNIHTELIARGLGFVTLAYRGPRAIAGAVFLHFANAAVFKFGASDRAEQEHRGNNLVMWETIKFLRKINVTTLHFGRTEIGHESLRRFKLGWGTEETPIDYLRFDPRTGEALQRNDRMKGWHAVVLGMMPMALSRWLGKTLYPHLD